MSNTTDRPSVTDVVVSSKKFKEWLPKGDPDMKLKEWWLGWLLLNGWTYNCPSVCKPIVPFPFIKMYCYYCHCYEQPMIFHAINFGNAESVKLLVERGADLEKKSVNPITIVEKYCCCIQPVTPLEYIQKYTCFGGCCISPEIIKLVTPKKGAEKKKIENDAEDCCCGGDGEKVTEIVTATEA